MKKLVAISFLVLAFYASAGEFRFNAMYSSHMVLQRGEPIRIAGFAEPGRTVAVSFRQSKARAMTDADGRWRVTLKACPAGGPFVLEATDGRQKLRLEDVMVGDVWYCTGQSNMWWPLAYAGDPEKEIAAADHPNIRLLDVATTGAEQDEDEPPHVRGWSRCTPVTARNFSACAYHFARTVRERLGDVPIGLIGAGWGGPPICHFLPPNRPGPADPAYLAKTREAMFAAAKGYAEQDRMLAECRAFFADESAMTARANERPDPSRGGEVELPSKKGLEHTIIDAFSGAVHFRRAFTLDAAWAARPAVLTLGQSSLPAVVFVNGRKVGTAKDWDAPVPGARGDVVWRFELAPGALSAGSNRVDVLVGCNDRTSWWGAFGNPLELTDRDEPARRIDLAGVWNYDRFVNIPVEPPSYGGSWGARIHPFFQMPVKGVLFYQGEADGGQRRSCADYLADHKRLVTLLREGWGKPDLPYYCMQLANHDSKNNGEAGNGFCAIREAQRLTAEELPACGTAVSIDIGKDLDSHPPNKREQGRRLALQALAKTYGCKDVVPEGPRFDKLVRTGGSTYVVFKPSPSPLVVRGGKLTGFEARAQGGAWTPVEAEVVGDRVKLAAPFAIKDVRYLWQNCPIPEAVLFNAAGLPAGPFMSCR